MSKKIIKLFLRLTISVSFLSAVADRFGLWSADVSVWGNWESFLAYTKIINPWFPDIMISPIAIVATSAEIIFALFLLVGFKTEYFAKLSGFLLIAFGLSMAFSTGIKGTLDYSVFGLAAAAFALSIMEEKYLEVDSVLRNR